MIIINRLIALKPLSLIFFIISTTVAAIAQPESKNITVLVEPNSSFEVYPTLFPYNGGDHENLTEIYIEAVSVTGGTLYVQGEGDSEINSGESIFISNGLFDYGGFENPLRLDAGIEGGQYVYNFSITDGTGTSNIHQLTFYVVEQLKTFNPYQNQDGVAYDQDIVVEFGDGIDQAFVSTSSVFVHGSYSGKIDGSISFAGNTMTFDPDVNFLPGEKISVTLTDQITLLSGELTPYYYEFTVGNDGVLSMSLIDDGAFSFSPIETINDIKLVDFNRDGLLDLALALSSENNKVFLNNGDGGFSNSAIEIESSSNKTFAFEFADLDGDGYLDVVSVNDDGYVEVYFNNGDGTVSLTPVQLGVDNGGYFDLAIGDLNRDGYLDIYALSSLNGDQAWLNNGDQSFSNLLVKYNSIDFPDPVYSLDVIISPLVNGEVNIVTTLSGGLLTATYQGGEFNQSSFLFETDYTLLLEGDFDLDKGLEFIALEDDLEGGMDLVLFQNDEIQSGVFKSTTTYVEDHVFFDLHGNDWNPLYIFVNASEDTYVFNNDFSTNNSITNLPSNMSFVDYGDVNGDGDLDFIFSDGSQVYIYLHDKPMVIDEPQYTYYRINESIYTFSSDDIYYPDQSGDEGELHTSVEILYTEVDNSGTLFLDNDLDGTFSAGDFEFVDGTDYEVAIADIDAGKLRYIFASGGIDYFEFGISDDGGLNYDFSYGLDIEYAPDLTFIGISDDTGVDPTGRTTISKDELNNGISFEFSDDINGTASFSEIIGFDGVQITGSISGLLKWNYESSNFGEYQINAFQNKVYLEFWNVDFIEGETVTISLNPNLYGANNSFFYGPAASWTFVVTNSQGSDDFSLALDEDYSDVTKNFSLYTSTLVDPYNQAYFFAFDENEGKFNTVYYDTESFGFAYWALGDKTYPNVIDLISIADSKFITIENDGVDSYVVYYNMVEGFGKELEFNTIAGASSIITSDVNSDGFLDLIIGSSTSNAVVHYGVGGSYREPIFDETPTAFGETATIKFDTYDLDGDLDLDLVEITSSKVKVWINDGVGGFSKTEYDISGVNLVDFVISDFTNDGFVDLILLDGNAVGDTKLMLGYGGDSFSEEVTINTASATSIRAIDLNNDSYLDFITASSGNTAQVFINNTVDGFEAQSIDLGSESPIAIYPYEINIKNGVDFFVNTSEGVQTFIYNEAPELYTPSFNQNSFYISPNNTNSLSTIYYEDDDVQRGDAERLVKVVEYTGDSKLQKFVTSSYQDVLVNETFTFSDLASGIIQVEAGLEGSDTIYIELFDGYSWSETGYFLVDIINELNIDSTTPRQNGLALYSNPVEFLASEYLDIGEGFLPGSEVFGSYGRRFEIGVEVSSSEPKYTFINPYSERYIAGEKVSHIFTGDVQTIEGSQNLSSSYQLQFIQKPLSGKNFELTEATSELPISGVNDVRLVMHWLNDRPDLFVMTSAGLDVYSQFNANDPSDYQSIGTSGYVASGTSQIFDINDLDNDWESDLVEVTDSELKIWWGVDLGEYEATPTNFTHSGIEELELADINNDGFLDIIYSTSSELKVLINDGSKFIEPDEHSYPLSSIIDHAIGDMNNDGHLDIYIATSGDDKVYLNGGDGTFTEFATVAISNDQSIVLEDFDADRNLDVLVVTGASNDNVIYLNQGDGSFNSTPILFESSTSYDDIDVGDLNGDGHLDVVTTSLTDGTKQFINDGFASFTQSTIGTDLFGTKVILGDLEFDYDLDLYVVTSTGITIYTNNTPPTAQNITRQVENTGGTEIVFFNPDDFGYQDANLDSFTELKIVSVPTLGSLIFNLEGDETVTDGYIFQYWELEDGLLRFEIPSGSTDKFTFQVSDGKTFSTETYQAVVTSTNAATIQNFYTDNAFTNDSTALYYDLSDTGTIYYAAFDSRIDMTDHSLISAGTGALDFGSYAITEAGEALSDTVLFDIGFSEGDSIYYYIYLDDGENSAIHESLLYLDIPPTPVLELDGISSPTNQSTLFVDVEFEKRVDDFTSADIEISPKAVINNITGGGRSYTLEIDVLNTTSTGDSIWLFVKDNSISYTTTRTYLGIDLPEGFEEEIIFEGGEPPIIPEGEGQEGGEEGFQLQEIEEKETYSFNFKSDTLHFYFDGIIETPSLITEDTTYIDGELLNISFKFNENVTVDWDGDLPYLWALLDVPSEKYIKVEYASGSGTDSLVFQYEIEVGDEDKNDLYIAYFSGGDVLDEVGNTYDFTDILINDFGGGNLFIDAIAEQPSISGELAFPHNNYSDSLVVVKNTNDGREVSHYKVTSILNGQLFKADSTSEISNSDFITAEEASDGLIFKPTTDFWGATSFEVTPSVTNDDTGLGTLLTVDLDIEYAPTWVSIEPDTSLYCFTEIGTISDLVVVDDALSTYTWYDSTGTELKSDLAEVTFSEAEIAVAYADYNRGGEDTVTLHFDVKKSYNTYESQLKRFTIQIAPQMPLVTVNNADFILTGNTYEYDVSFNEFESTDSLIYQGESNTTDYNWYASDMNLITTVSHEVGEDQKIDLYDLGIERVIENSSSNQVFNVFVSQVDESGCESELIEIQYTILADTEITAPSVVTQDSIYINGETISVLLDFEEDVFVSTDPSFVLTLDNTVNIPVQLDYVSGSGTDSLYFEYDVQIGDMDIDGISISSYSGVVTDLAGNEFSFSETYPVALDGGEVKIDALTEAAVVTGDLSFPQDDFSDLIYVNKNANDGRELTHYKVSSFVEGQLYLSDSTTQITDGDFITVAQAEAGLVFMPNASYVGGASFNVTSSVSSDALGLGEEITVDLDVEYVPTWTDNSTEVANYCFLDLGSVSTLSIEDDALSTYTWYDSTGAELKSGVSEISLTESEMAAAYSNFNDGGTFHFDVQRTYNSNSSSVKRFTVVIAEEIPLVTISNTDFSLTGDVYSFEVSYNDFDEQDSLYYGGESDVEQYVWTYSTGDTTVDASGENVGFIAVADLGVVRGDASSDQVFTITVLQVVDGCESIERTITYTVLADTEITAPTVVTQDSTYVNGETISVLLDFEEDVFVSTAPSFVLTLDNTVNIPVQLDYVSGSGTDSLYFEYDVQIGDMDIDGISISSYSGIVTDLAGNEFSFSETYPVALDGGEVKIDALTEAAVVTGDLSFPQDDFSGLIYVNKNANDGRELTHYKVSSYVEGQLYLSDSTTQITDGDFITVAQAEAGLVFMPSASYVGSASFNVTSSVSNDASGLGEEITVDLDVEYVPTWTDNSNEVANYCFLDLGNISTLSIEDDALSTYTWYDSTGAELKSGVSEVSLTESEMVAAYSNFNDGGTFHFDVQRTYNSNSSSVKRFTVVIAEEIPLVTISNTDFSLTGDVYSFEVSYNDFDEQDSLYYGGESDVEQYVWTYSTGDTTVDASGENVGFIAVADLGVVRGDASSNQVFTITVLQVVDGCESIERTITYTILADTEITAPSVVTLDSTYINGETISVLLDFEEDVFVSTDPSFVLTLDNTVNIPVQLDYVSGSGTDSLYFEYDVQIGDMDIDGISISSYSGVVTDLAGNEFSFSETYPVALDGGEVKIDALTEAAVVTGDLSFPQDDFSGLIYVNKNANDGRELTHYKVSSFVEGQLYLSDSTTQITDGDFITVAQAEVGLVFMPSASYVGGASFNVTSSVSSDASGLGEEITVDLDVEYVPTWTDNSTEVANYCFLDLGNISTLSIEDDALSTYTWYDSTGTMLKSGVSEVSLTESEMAAAYSNFNDGGTFHFDVQRTYNSNSSSVKRFTVVIADEVPFVNISSFDFDADTYSFEVNYLDFNSEDSIRYEGEDNVESYIWYDSNDNELTIQDASETNSIAVTDLGISSTDQTMDEVFNFKLAQVVDGCEGEPVNVVYTISSAVFDYNILSVEGIDPSCSFEMSDGELVIVIEREALLTSDTTYQVSYVKDSETTNVNVVAVNDTLRVSDLTLGTISDISVNMVRTSETIEKPYSGSITLSYPEGCLQLEDYDALVDLYTNSDSVNFPWDMEDGLDKASSWTGITLNDDGYIEAIDLSEQGIRNLDLSHILSLSALENVSVDGNNIDFNDLASASENDWTSFVYSPQDSIYLTPTQNVYVGDTLTITLPSFENATYEWYKGDEVIGESDSIFSINRTSSSDAGNYYAIVNSDDYTDLTLYTSSVDVTIVGSVVEADSLALLSLFESLGIEDWDRNAPIREWPRVGTGDSDRITSLDLRDLDISELPSELFSLEALERLILFNNNLSDLPVDLIELVNLEYLDLDNNNFTSLPEDIFKLESIQVISFFNNQLTTLGDSDELLSGVNTDSIPIKSLILSYNQLTEIPDFVGEIPSLEQLDVSHNNLTSLDYDMSGNTKLVELYASNNNISNVSSSIQNLTQLERLDLSNNELDSLPTSISALNLFNMNINVSVNKLAFDQLEMLLGASELVYEGQVITTNSVELSLEVGDTLLLTADVEGDYNTYSWYNDGSEIENQINDTLQVNDITALESGVYYGYVSNIFFPNLRIKTDTYYVGVACDDISGDGWLVNESDTLICEGTATPVTLRAEVPTDVSVSSYVWLKDGEVLPFTTGNILTTYDIGNYQVRVINEQGCSILTNSISVSETPSPEVRLVLSEDGVLIVDTDQEEFSTYWFKDGVLMTDVDPNSMEYAPIYSGIYQVSIETQSGCVGYSQLVNYQTTITSVEDVTKELSLLPNPTTGKLRIVADGYLLKDMMVSVYSSSGERMKNVRVDLSNESIDLSDLPTGVYFIELVHDDTRKILKIMKQ
ncbi:FG-GAP-like repeat-containing protein [Sediminitomix flava]|uniref:Putative secreted protein (Por secretion system target) n=1 Tax=Sediminitomix flava TaxID=379075 RepID=A0A316A2P1_SEDFL|nr:FG-GAP-like repeat-containing protein [Sediminitomix flava]PWJ43977.1 putative secreted protein (Por secretion system target) [Sediminitomix flava]